MLYVTLFVVLILSLVIIIQVLLLKVLVQRLTSYSKWMIQVKDTISSIFIAVDKIDETGHFKTQDQVQVIWQRLKMIIKQLNLFIEDQQE